jgi:hypothetical protein
MRGQLDSLLHDVADRGVRLRMIPFDANGALTYMFNIIDFGGAYEKSIAAFDAMTGMSFRKDPKDVLNLKVFVGSLRELAHSPEGTVEYIKTIRKEIAHG